MRPGSIASKLCLTMGVLLLASCVTAGGGGERSRGQQTMNCVNRVMNTQVGLPDIVILKRSQFADLFGAQYDGYYVGREQRVYLSSRGDATMLAHELAHHVQVSSGRHINEAEAEQVAMRCAGGRGWRG
jgi:hypothetical protein